MTPENHASAAEVDPSSSTVRLCRSTSVSLAGNARPQQSPDQVLAQFGAFNPYVFFVFFCMSIVWALAAMPMMSSAFIMGDVCVDSNCTLTPGTITEEFNLTGTRASYAEWTTSAFLFGNMVGGSVLPQLSDRHGRRPIFLTSLLLIGILGSLSAACPDVYSFTFMRFAQGAFFPGCVVTNWVLAYESIPLTFRSYTALFFGLWWVVGYCVVTPLAYYLNHWRLIVLSTSGPSIVFAVFYYFTIPESFHFVVAKQQRSKISQWLSQANRYSRRDGYVTVDVDTLVHSPGPEALDRQPEEPEKCNGRFVAHLLRNRLLLLYTLFMVYLWTCDTFVYYGLSLFSTQLAGNKYVNYTLMGLVELPSYIVSPILLDRLGRRLFVSLTHFITMVSFIVVLFSSHPTLTLCMWLLGKFAISCAFTSLFVYSSEVFPTVFRNGCIGVCVVVARLGGAFAPAVRTMSVVSPILPTVFFAVIAGLGGGITLLLPETLNQELPDSPSQLAHT
ncbi:sugar transporter [Aphelenchoides avenae]|nr:sugar transporter [Aphelenchus avenae]